KTHALTLRPDLGTRRTTSELVQHVGRGDDSDDLLSLHDRKATDELPTHQIGCLSQGGGGSDRGRARSHEIANGSIPADTGSFAPPEIPLGNHAEQLRAFHDHEMAKVIPLHARPGVAG